MFTQQRPANASSQTAYVSLRKGRSSSKDCRSSSSPRLSMNGPNSSCGQCTKRPEKRSKSTPAESGKPPGAKGRQDLPMLAPTHPAEIAAWPRPDVPLQDKPAQEMSE